MQNYPAEYMGIEIIQYAFYLCLFFSLAALPHSLPLSHFLSQEFLLSQSSLVDPKVNVLN